MAATFAKNHNTLWPDAFVKGITAMQFYGGATVGMRTMLDPLVPAFDFLLLTGDIALAAEKAKEGMERTKNMAPLAGRSNYIQPERMRGIPDPGAYAVYVAFDVARELSL